MSKKLVYLISFILVLSLVLVSGAKAADPNLVGWWPLDEGAGDIAIDLSGSGNDGTISNLNGGLGPDGSVWVDDPERGTVISFNGTAEGAFVRAGDIPQMTLTNDFTWAFWAKHSDENTADNDIILGNRMDENAVDFVPRQFIKFTPTKFEWHMNGNGDDNLDYDDIVADVWLHHAVVKTADQLTYYRNGIEASSGTFTQALDFPQPLFFGGDNEAAAGENWSGLMSDVRIHNRALTGLEIVAAKEGVEEVNMEVGFATQPPVIDGEVDYMWEGASTQYFVPLDDPANASGSWKLLYDSENLYVIVDVTDDSLQNDSASSWQDDSVEIYFDGGNTKVNTPLSGDDHQYTFGWTTDEIQGTNIDGATEGIEQAQVDTDTGWRIEIKLPWLSLQGAMPQARDLIGIDCYYNDDDDGGDTREGKMLTFSTVEFWNDASGWGTAVLAAIPEPVDPGTDGLAAFYALDNDVLDSSGNGNDGTVVGNPTFVDGPAGYGMALEFDGESYVDCGNDPSLDIPGPISIALWIKPGADDPEGQGTATAPLCKALSGASPSWSWQVRYGWNSPQPYMAFTFNTSPRAWAYVGKNLDRDEWVHIAGTHDGTTLKCYLNGVETDSTPMGAITSSPAPLLIGSDGWSDDWIGAIDEVAIYDRDLSVGQIRYLAGQRVPVEAPRPVGHWTLDEGSGTTVADVSGNGNDGTIMDNPDLDDPTWIAGVYGGALEFHGTGVAGTGGDFIDCGNDASLDITGPISIALWIRPDADDPEGKGTSGGETAPMAKATSDWSWQVRYGWGGAPTPYMSFTFNTSPRAWASVGRNLERYEWCHIACSYDGTTLKCYLDGVETDSTPMGEIHSSADPVLIGSDGWKSDWTGGIDDVRIYDRGLSADEIVDVAAGL